MRNRGNEVYRLESDSAESTNQRVIVADLCGMIVTKAFRHACPNVGAALVLCILI